INTSSNGTFVNGLITDLLGRAADTALFMKLVAPIDTAFFPLLNPTVFSNLLLTTPYRDHVVTEVFDLVLDRAPTSGSSSTELEKERANLAAGKARESLMARLAGSQEYFNLVVNGNRAIAADTTSSANRDTWIKAIFKLFLNRDAKAT